MTFPNLRGSVFAGQLAPLECPECGAVEGYEGDVAHDEDCSYYDFDLDEIEDT